ncbi:MAG: hypothetical protein E7294_13355 [Lachnospiraceae bacterium]|jgi:hypothetical protein|nr:hypothetical protein [Lachnospiraceae bacterium]
MQHFTKTGWGKRALAFLLSAAMVASGTGMGTVAKAVAPTPQKASNVIAISSAEELAKIGSDSSYPMTGDYILTEDIDLSGRNWESLGGYIGNKGTMNPKDPNVFSGTFDGQGHVISGMTIHLDGTVSGKYGQVGLFSVIAGSEAQDPANVKNIIFTDVDIRTDFSDGLAAIGTLAGEVNGYSGIENIAVLNGQMIVSPSKQCDVVGAGGIIGECRTEDGIGNTNVSVSDCYNGMDINANSSTSLNYTGGMIGRIAKTACKSITSCLNTGVIQFEGYDGYGIAGVANQNGELAANISDCYYLDNGSTTSIGEGITAVAEKDLKNGTKLAGLSDKWSAVKDCYQIPSQVLTSSAAGYVYLASLSLSFAEGEKSSAVKTQIGLPDKAGEVSVSWKSSDESVLRIEGNTAIADTKSIGADTPVILTAYTEEGYSLSFKVTVKTENEQKAVFDRDYAKVGEPLKVSVQNAGELQFTYQWSVGGKTIANTGDTYTPTKDDLEKFITVKVTATDNSVFWNLTTYLSELPVVYVETDDGAAVTSNTVDKDAHIRVQGNDEFPDTKYLYDGATTIRGRGNSTWSWASGNGVKKPYKLKLKSKADLLGIGGGKNKHWVLLADAIDHTNMRNILVYEFSRDIGMECAMGTTNVVLILNGSYEGTYELCEHIRVGSSRVDIHDWEGMAEDIAEAICAKETTLDADALTSAMEENYDWYETGNVNFKNKTYKISDYYTEEIPKFTGGFLLDMDFRVDGNPTKYISTFTTTQGGFKMFFRRPEYAKTSNEMMNFTKGYLDAYEAALRGADFTTTYDGKKTHYTDLFDMDSLVKYWLVNEYTNNWDSMKNSTYLYKALNGKAKMGPAWDYDWAWGNINMYSMTGPFVYDNWHTVLDSIPTNQGGFQEVAYQGQSWYLYLVKDPYFITKAYEAYHAYRPTVIEDMIKEGGKIDTLEKKNRTASEANDEKWKNTYGGYRGFAFVNGEKQYITSQTYHEAVTSMKTFIEKRLEWMDEKFSMQTTAENEAQVTEQVKKLYGSFGNSVSDKISVTVTTDGDGKKTAVADVKDKNAGYVEFVVNGKSVEADGSIYVPVSDGKAEITIGDDLLGNPAEYNTVMVLGINNAKNAIAGEMNFTNFQAAVPDKITGTVSIQGETRIGETLKAVVENCNYNDLTYIWYADDSKIEEADGDSLTLTAAELGKTIKVSVVSGVGRGSLESAPTAKVKEQEKPVENVEKTGLIINQIYGGGAAGDVPMSHDFIELYNNSDQDIDLTGYKISYLSNRAKQKGGYTDGAVVSLELNGTIKAHTSYLIRAKQEETATYEGTTLLPYQVPEGDIEWPDRIIDNKQYQVIVYDKDGKVTDAVSVGEAEDVNADITDMTRLPGDAISKQKALRRRAFGNFETVTYYDSTEQKVLITTEEELKTVTPKNSGDGVWGTSGSSGENSQDPKPSDSPKPSAPNTAEAAEVVKAPQKKGTFITKGTNVFVVIKDSATAPEVAFKNSTNKKVKKISLPATITEGGVTYTVTAIADNACRQAKKLTGFTIPKTVTTIGAKAFYNAKNLKKITVKSTVLKKVGKNAFKGIHKKAVIKVPKKQKKAYQKLLKKKGQAATVMIK